MTECKVPNEAIVAFQEARHAMRRSATPSSDEEEIAAGIEAALPVMFEVVHQQRDEGSYWSDQHEAVKNWWDGRENSPTFRVVYQLKEPK